MAGLTIQRECVDCGGTGWRDDYPAYVYDTSCHTCKANGRVWIQLTEATDGELADAARERWEWCDEATQEASAYAHEAQEIEAEQKRRQRKEHM